VIETLNEFAPAITALATTGVLAEGAALLVMVHKHERVLFGVEDANREGLVETANRADDRSHTNRRALEREEIIE